MAELKKHKTWAEIPEEIRESLSSEETIEKIEQIGSRQGLSPMEQGFLVRICANLMKGNIAPGIFVSTIGEELDISAEKAALLAKDINHDIFSPLKDALRAVHAKAGGVVKLDPSLVTCLPGQMSKAAALGNRAPGNAPVGNILEQKLAGTFRIKEGEVLGSPVSSSASSPRLVVPPPPQVARPAFTPPAHHPVEPTSTDPYRAHAL